MKLNIAKKSNNVEKVKTPPLFLGDKFAVKPEFPELFVWKVKIQSKVPKQYGKNKTQRKAIVVHEIAPTAQEAMKLAVERRKVKPHGIATFIALGAKKFKPFKEGVN